MLADLTCITRKLRFTHFRHRTGEGHQPNLVQTHDQIEKPPHLLSNPTEDVNRDILTLGKPDAWI